jgi:hypothetical protein
LERLEIYCEFDAAVLSGESPYASIACYLSGSNQY